MAFDTLVDKTKLETALTATADAIRAKVGTTDKIIWDENNGFASAVSTLTSEEQNPSGIIPANIKSAAMEIVNKVNEVRKSDSIVFMAMADSHHTGEQSDTGWQTLTNLGNLHAGMAAKVLSYALNLDFVCHLGDMTFGHGTTTSEQLHQQIGEMNGWLDEAWAGVPRFQTVGNHDTGYYAYENSGVPMETNEYLFSVFGKYCEGSVYGSETYGYCYRDFEDKKLRVICLNTSEGDSLNASYECSPAQLLWFAQALKSVGAKTGWSVIVIGHYPLDYVGMHDATSVVKAYIDGSSIALNGATVNFSGSNNAKFVANFHGHTHCFKVARLNTLDTSTKKASEYDALRVGIPNTGFYRNNHQEGPNAYGLYFEEDVTYDKVNDGIHDTAFVVNVITPSEEVIHSFCYGAGYDRVIGYGDIVYHKITKDIQNATVTSPMTSVENGSSYTATITPNEHCAITSVIITMGGVDITSSVYTDGIINIPSVTGDIVINVKATIALACTNQIPISTNVNGNIYGGDYNGDGANDGYKTKTYIHTNAGQDEANTAKCTTGFIPAKINDVIRMQNMSLMPTEGNDRIAFYDADKNFLYIVQANSSWYMNTKFDSVTDSNGNYIQFTISDGTEFAGFAYIRICCSTINNESILTVNEEIKYVDEVDGVYDIEYNLDNVTSTCNHIVAVKNNEYSTTIAPKPAHTIDDVVITMGGVDITSSVYSNKIITIPSVTGNIVITASAINNEDIVVSYTNQLPISTDASGNVYNGKGYKENTYISSGNDGTKSGIYTTGFIPCKLYDTLYCKNVGMQTGQDAHRLMFYNADKSFTGAGVKTNNANYTGFTYGDDGNISTIIIKLSGNNSNTAYVRFCCGYLGNDSIVTVNEPIE